MKNTGRLFLVVLNLWLTHGLCRADKITTTSGRILSGVVIQTNADEVLVLADYGTCSIPATLIKSVEPELDKRPTTGTTNRAAIPGRLPAWNRVIAKLAGLSWAGKLKQIPATVIAEGVFKNVPYISFHCGEDYEVNIYGDLDNPAGIEIGLYRLLLTKEYGKDHAISFISLLLQPEELPVLKSLVRTGDLKIRDGLTFEITPETSADAYGGWWVSVYDQKALKEAQATDEELASISVRNSAIIKSEPANNSGWTSSDLTYARAQVTPAPAYVPNDDGVSPDHNHGSVYVHGYYRSSGTYVQPYTRRR